MRRQRLSYHHVSGILDELNTCGAAPGDYERTALR